MAKKKSPPSDSSLPSTRAQQRRPPTRKPAAEPSSIERGVVASDDQPLAVAHDTAEPASRPTRDEIAAVAYRRFLNRGGGHGQDVEDWLEAELELRRGSR
jgi:hypothetical protein